jgi:hypothetical protein
MDEASGSDTHGRAQRTERAEGRALVERWRASGQTVAQFCRERAVPVHRLHYWKRQAEPVAQSEDAPTASEFLAVEIENETSSKASRGAAIEIAVGAIRVQLPLGCDRASFVRILRWTAEALGA